MFKITNVMINRLKIHIIVIQLSLLSRLKHVKSLSGFSGQSATHPIHEEEVLRKVDCPALNVRARCAPSSSACTCVTRERERTLLLSFSLSFFSRSVPNTRGAIYFRCRYFRNKNPGERGERVKVPGCRAATVRARTVRALAYERVRTH